MESKENGKVSSDLKESEEIISALNDVQPPNYRQEIESQENDDKIQVDFLEKPTFELESHVENVDDNQENDGKSLEFGENQEKDTNNQVDYLENLIKSYKLSIDPESYIENLKDTDQNEDKRLKLGKNTVNTTKKSKVEFEIPLVQNGPDQIYWFDRLIPVKRHPKILLNENLVDGKTSDFRIIRFEILTIVCLSIAILFQISLLSIIAASKGPKVVVPSIPAVAMENMKSRFEHLAVIDSNQTVWDVSLYPHISPSYSKVMSYSIPMLCQCSVIALPLLLLCQSSSCQCTGNSLAGNDMTKFKSFLNSQMPGNILPILIPKASYISLIINYEKQ